MLIGFHLAIYISTLYFLIKKILFEVALNYEHRSKELFNNMRGK